MECETINIITEYVNKLVDRCIWSNTTVIVVVGPPRTATVNCVLLLKRKGAVETTGKRDLSTTSQSNEYRGNAPLNFAI